MTTTTLPHPPQARAERVPAPLAEFAATHANCIVCLMYHKSYRTSAKLTHVYWVVKDGQPERLPAHKTIGASLPRYTLDLERGCAWRDFTGHDLLVKHLARHHINEAYLSEREYTDLVLRCQARALQINRWLKNRRIAALRQKGLLS